MGPFEYFEKIKSIYTPIELSSMLKDITIEWGLLYYEKNDLNLKKSEDPYDIGNEYFEEEIWDDFMIELTFSDEINPYFSASNWGLDDFYKFDALLREYMEG